MVDRDAPERQQEEIKQMLSEHKKVYGRNR